MAAIGHKKRSSFTIKPWFLLIIHVLRVGELISYNNILAVLKI